MPNPVVTIAMVLGVSGGAGCMAPDHSCVREEVTAESTYEFGSPVTVAEVESAIDSRSAADGEGRFGDSWDSNARQYPVKVSAIGEETMAIRVTRDLVAFPSRAADPVAEAASVLDSVGERLTVSFSNVTMGNVESGLHGVC